MCFEIWMREVHVDLEVFQMPRMVMIMYKKKVEEVNRADKDDQLVENPPTGSSSLEQRSN